MSLRTRATMLVSLALVGAAPALPAQVVQGRVRLATDRAAGEVSVLLVDAAAGAVVAAALTDSAGRYALRAPNEGAYRVRARRIGFAPDSSSVLQLTGGATTTFDALLTPRALVLAKVVVRETRRCVALRDTDSLTAGLWQEVQNALAGAIATAANARLGFTLRRFERQLDPTGERVVRARTWEARTVATQPYVAIAAESLAASGFVRAEGRDTVYAAPDARTLSSDAFTRTHCLRPTVDPERPALIGLAFEPVGGEHRPGDVTGTLWVDRASSELKTLEYRYTGRRTGPPAVGRLEYRRLSTGTWVVGAWVVRVPVVAAITRAVPATGDRIGRSARLRQDIVLETAAVWEIGGDVGEVFDPGNVPAPGTATSGTVRGVIVDSASRQGVDRVLVELTPTQGAALRTLTAGEGTFAFDSVPRGDYLLTATAARFDTLNTFVRPLRVSVGPAAQLNVRITLPPAADGIASLCPTENPPGTTVMHGTVVDGGSGRPVAGARVSVQWLTGGTRQGRTSFADSEGRYAICGLPSDQKVTLNVSSGTLRAPPIPLDPLATPMRLQTITIPAAGGAKKP